MLHIGDALLASPFAVHGLSVSRVIRDRNEMSDMRQHRGLGSAADTGLDVPSLFYQVRSTESQFAGSEATRRAEHEHLSPAQLRQNKVRSSSIA